MAVAGASSVLPPRRCSSSAALQRGPQGQEDAAKAQQGDTRRRSWLWAGTGSLAAWLGLSGVVGGGGGAAASGDSVATASAWSCGAIGHTASGSTRPGSPLELLSSVVHLQRQLAQQRAQIHALQLQLANEGESRQRLQERVARGMLRQGGRFLLHLPDGGGGAAPVFLFLVDAAAAAASAPSATAVRDRSRAASSPGGSGTAAGSRRSSCSGDGSDGIASLGGAGDGRQRRRFGRQPQQHHQHQHQHQHQEEGFLVLAGLHLDSGGQAPGGGASGGSSAGGAQPPAAMWTSQRPLRLLATRLLHGDSGGGGDGAAAAWRHTAWLAVSSLVGAQSSPAPEPAATAEAAAATEPAGAGGDLVTLLLSAGRGQLVGGLVAEAADGPRGGPGGAAAAASIKLQLPPGGNGRSAAEWAAALVKLAGRSAGPG